jgi:hypothetical protein
MQHDTLRTAIPGTPHSITPPENLVPLSKRALNCKKAREKRSEYAAMREELEYLRQLLRHRTVSDLYSTCDEHSKKVNLY